MKTPRVQVGDTVDVKQGPAVYRAVVREINPGICGKPRLRVEPASGAPPRWVDSRVARVIR